MEHRIPLTLDRLVRFGLGVHDSFTRIAASGPGPGPIRPDDHATLVDRDLESALVDLVHDGFGAAEIVAEERVSDGLGVLGAGAQLRVHIDPIDGTHLFNRGAAGFTSTIGFECSGRLVAGMVYSPAVRRLCLARRGQGITTVHLGRPAGAPEPGTGPPAVPVDGPAGPPASGSDGLADPPGGTVAVKSSLRAALPALDQALARGGFRVANLGSVAGRLEAVAGGTVAGVVKDVRATHGVPRLWGIAAGLLLCAEAGVPLFWDPDGRVLVAGDPRIAERLDSARITSFGRYDLDPLWNAVRAVA